MWSVILQILAVLGILLLAILGLALVLVLLVLFFPVSYHAYGKIDEAKVTLRVRAHWLFGILRARGGYPQPGKITVKLLWFTLFDSGKEKRQGRGEKKKRKKPQKAREAEMADTREGLEDCPEPCDSTGQQASVPDPGRDTPDSGRGTLADVPEEQQTESPEEGTLEETDGILAKFTKLKYTFRTIYDKIKKIWKNISYYAALLQEEATGQCLRRAGQRIGKILRNIRPRKYRADIVFGTGSPDTTGYLYGAFCMVSPRMGRHVVLTPDFMEAVLSGQAEISGRITLAVLLWNGLQLFLDEDLRAWIKG